MGMKKSFFLKLKNGVNLESAVEQAGQKKKWPTVLLVPGFHSDLHEWGYFDQITSGLVKAGFAVYRFSFSGSGKSTGNVYDITLSRQVDELRNFVTYVRKQPGVDTKRLGLLAQSFGVATVIAASPVKVESIVFTSGAYYPRKSIENLFKELGVFNPSADSFFEADYDSVRIGPAFWKDMERFDMDKMVQKINQPLLILHGKKDHVPWPWAKKVYGKVRSPKRIELHEEAVHGFEGHREWLIEKVTEWFKDTLS